MSATQKPAGKAVVKAAPARKATPVAIGNTGKGLLLSDLDTLSRLWTIAADVELARVRAIGSLVERGFSGRAIADGFTVRTGRKAPKGFNSSTVAYYVATYKALRDTKPAGKPATDAQAEALADMLLSIIGANEADGGARKGFDATVASVQGQTAAASVVTVRKAYNAMCDARSKRLAAPAVRPPVIGAQGGTKPADEPQEPQDGKPAPAAPAPAADSITAASFSRLMAELNRRVHAKGFSITASDRASFDEIAAIVESVATVKA